MSAKHIMIATALGLLVLGTPGPVAAACRDATVSATGIEKTGIEDATASASAALVAEIARTYGQGWGVGSRRHGSFHCDKHLGGRKPGWTCSARTTVICKP